MVVQSIQKAGMVAVVTLMALTALFTFTGPVALAQQQADQTAQPSTSQAGDMPTTSGTNADNICKGVLSAETGRFDPNTTVAACQESGDSSFGFLIRRIINVFSIIVGAVSVIMIIIGGFRYVISGGDSSGVSGAKNTILYAIVGLVIVIFAQVIIRFILTNAVSVAK